MDFLGLRTLSVLDGAVKNIESNGKGKIDLNEIPIDDAKTYEMLQRGDTLGVFQLESSGMTALVRRLRPDCFEDMIALVALYRPGPLESGMVDTYVKCKHGEDTVRYLHPKLEPYMKDTYGVKMCIRDSGNLRHKGREAFSAFSRPLFFGIIIERCV